MYQQIMIYAAYFQRLLPVACYVCFIFLKFSFTPETYLALLCYFCYFMERFKKVTSHESNFSLIPYHLTNALCNLYITSFKN
jgi:hypothetical protein